MVRSGNKLKLKLSAINDLNVWIDDITVAVAGFLGQQVPADYTHCEDAATFARLWQVRSELDLTGSHEFRFQDISAAAVVFEPAVVQHEAFVARLKVQRHKLCVSPATQTRPFSSVQ